MAATVWMRHPSLPADQLIQVPEVSLPHHQAAGWEVTEAPARPKLAPRNVEDAVPNAPASLPQDAGGEVAAADDTPEDPAPDAEAAAAPKRTRKTATKAEEN
ncbi:MULTISPECIES: hypothetical protein [unclassified Streptomyces]|uniref:hypothetical protein n=1 Tax=unclassified Streptomyces TaxID=2593676 RepID=UPI002FEF4E2C